MNLWLIDIQVWTAGQVIGLIHDVPTCDVLVKRIEREAKEALQKSSGLWQDSAKI
jgi:NADH:quinone reductase (non-electrogenic)